jgi:alpha-1,4-digalacturonate transport system substrate-binding protein
MKKKLAAVLSLVMMAGLAGCGSTNPADGGTSSGENDGAAKGSQTIKVMLSEEPGEGDAFASALRSWETATGNKVDIMVIPYDDQLTKFPAMAKAKDLPDLIATTRLHQLYPEEFMDMSEAVDISKFEETALKIVGKDYLSDKMTGLTLQYTTTNMYYNKDAFAKAGIEVPTVEDPWTWEELYENAAKLQADGGVKYGFAADSSRARYDILMYANGGSLVEKDGDSFAITVNSPQNVATLDRFVAENNKVMPKAIWSGGTTDNPSDYFKNGDVGVYLSGSWNYNTFSTDISNFEFGVMPTPVGEAGSSAIIGGAAVAIPEQAKNKEAAMAFVKWLYEDENFQNFLNNDKGLSAVKTVMYQPSDEKAAADFAVLQAEVKSITDTFMIDESSAWRQYLDNEYREYLKQAVSGELTAKEALDSFAKDLAEKSEWKMK